MEINKKVQEPLKFLDFLERRRRDSNSSKKVKYVHVASKSMQIGTTIL